MKKIKILLAALLVAQNLCAQVGIGLLPEEMSDEELQVKGELIITDKVGQKGVFPSLQEFKNPNSDPKIPRDYRVIAIDPNQEIVNGQAVNGRVKELYDQKNVLPIIIQPYNVKNVYGDDLNDLDLKLPTADYYVALTNFEAIDNKGNGFYEPSGSNNKGRFEYYVFQAGGTWHVKIGNPQISPSDRNNAFDYNFDIIIYPNRFFKDLGEVVYPNVGQNGSASTPIVK